ncbi:NADP-dependent oxidoreductase [Subtercola endophyticus]|uniref:NADP-dependent oxidoreductase n=1 Tax=Subtercola endophyticus TaxID=2895559 RepID=UPI001E4DD2E2|nr:NADP-dependent oxidoreductase [Subtercola endophyticus]UFS58443.1 NADP-dependent oxidoreductase [Subtercola endophyticus]
MKAMIFETYGGPEVLHEAEVPTPELKPGQVLVRVRLAAVNPYDLKLRSGAMQQNVHPTFPVIPGSELAGVVAAVGPALKSSVVESTVWPPLQVGDAVFGWGVGGSYAEFSAAKAVIRKPEDLHWETAASLVVAGATALRCLRQLAVTSGETLLVHGGAGAVGSAAVQIAVHEGITVIATCSERDAEIVREFGAHPVRYGEGFVERVRELAPDGVDAVLDTAGAGTLPGSIELAGGVDRVLTIADTAAFALGVTFSGGGAGEQTPDVLQKIADLALSGVLTPPPTRHFPLTEAAQAQAALAAGGFRGKTLLDV